LTAAASREVLFDRLAVVPYAYRHSYAQRHADQGVAPDVLRDLSGLGAATNTAALQADLEHAAQANLELKRLLDERDEDLAATRETNRRLMNQLNRSGS
jgi:hypothetical protein